MGLPRPRGFLHHPCRAEVTRGRGKPTPLLLRWMVIPGNVESEEEEMKLVVGLGNPGAAYERTRHNIGFRVVDKLATKQGWTWNERRARAVLASGSLGSEKVALAKPLTYMNLSGESVAELARWYKITPQDILVVYDELDLPLGQIRLRADGSAGGHNGVDSIIHYLHTKSFPRMRIGIGRPSNNRIEGKDFVLGIPTLDERITLESSEDRAVEAIILAVTQGLATTMNLVNTDPEKLKRQEEARQRKLLERAERERLKHEKEAQES